MRQDSFLSSIDDLQAWFEMNQTAAEKKPYFTLYRGYQVKQDCIIYRNTEIDDPNQAWDILEDVITRHAGGGGGFRIYITSKPLNNLGMTTLLKLPAPAGVQPGIAGVQGVGMWGIYGSPQEMVAAEVEKRMEVYELKRELEDLKAGQAAMSGVEQFKQLLADVPQLGNLLQLAGMKLLGMQPQVQPAHVAAGVPAPAEGIRGAGEPEGYDYEIVEPALDKLRRVFPNVEMTIDTLADWATQNPEMARQLFGNLNQPG